MQNKIFVANWKMNVPGEGIARYIAHLPKDHSAHVMVVIAPPFPYIPLVAQLTKKSYVKLAAQNVHAEARGAFTGEVSAEMLKRFGVQYVIVGHSERRKFFGETDVTVQRKTQAVLRAGLTPILCIGETSTQKKRRETNQVVLTQLRKALEGIRNPRMIIAYEPVWAIGTGVNATPQQAQTVHVLIRAWLKRKYGKNNTTPILYGGSVTPKNSYTLSQQPDVNGFLVGGASLSSTQFLTIIQSNIKATHL